MDAVPASIAHRIVSPDGENGEVSGLLENLAGAHKMNRGSSPDLRKPEGESDFYFVQADDPEIAVPRILELVRSRILSLLFNRSK